MPELPTPIVSPEALRERGLAGLRVLDARMGPDARERYAARHLEGAVFVDLETELSGDTSRPERGGRHPLPSLEDWALTLGRLGITPTTPVVVYDDAGGAKAAARAWWMLRAVGHDAVAVLDGGLPAAEAAGLPTASGETTVEPAPPYPVERWVAPTKTIDEVAALGRDEGWRLIDVRARERYRGDREPLDPAAGHIPGARNVPLAENLDEGGRFLAPEALRALYAERLGDVSAARVVVSCGSGVTACHTVLALEHAGLPGASLYVGSWSEWCRSGREGATGDTP
ncbi:MAG TPA: sulfurtransferase [Sandaracinaceae bacterium LLY-WYZ-13_1]|nr:sulfurtransferase [Sandaracinaceae bacterium LLY-WYZ-13_1]